MDYTVGEPAPDWTQADYDRIAAEQDARSRDDEARANTDSYHYDDRYDARSLMRGLIRDWGWRHSSEI